MTATVQQVYDAFVLWIERNPQYLYPRIELFHDTSGNVIDGFGPKIVFTWGTLDEALRALRPPRPQVGDTVQIGSRQWQVTDLGSDENSIRIAPRPFLRDQFLWTYVDELEQAPAIIGGVVWRLK